MVNLGGTAATSTSNRLAAILAVLRDQSLVSLCQTTVTLDAAPVVHARGFPTVERLNRCLLAVMVSPTPGARFTPPLAESLARPLARSYSQCLCTSFSNDGTPAPAPKLRGKSPGWTPGQPRSRRIRYPTVRKRFRKPKTDNKKSA